MVIAIRANSSHSVIADKKTHCKRCDSRLFMGDYEPECLNCGYAEYSYTQAKLPKNNRGILSTATRFIIRYSGEFANLAQTLAHVKLVRSGHKVVYDVKCPFCEEHMEQTSLSGKRPDMREQRYKCPIGHRLSLIPNHRGVLGWR